MYIQSTTYSTFWKCHDSVRGQTTDSMNNPMIVV